MNNDHFPREKIEPFENTTYSKEDYLYMLIQKQEFEIIEFKLMISNLEKEILILEKKIKPENKDNATSKSKNFKKKTTKDNIKSKPSAVESI